MTVETRGHTRWLLTAVAAMASVALGAGGTYVYMRRSMTTTEHPAREPVVSSPSPAIVGAGAMPADGTLPDVTITLTAEAVRRAGIVVAPVREGSEATVLHVPGIVEANAYRQVVVTPLVAGRVSVVSVSLGDRVVPGQALVQIYSPELADAETRYVTMSAELEAAHQRLLRTERLVGIGAASTQELESTRIEHAVHSTGLEGARARLALLGLSPDQIVHLQTAADVTATVTVAAPLAGVVTERSVNVGLNVDSTTALLKVVDLSTVWVVADLYDHDFASVNVGSPVTVTTVAYPGLMLPGQVSYVAPQVDAASRTAKVRIEVVNHDRRLLLGMYADVSVRRAAASGALVVPRSALQTVGGRHVLYLADPKQPGTFVERDVRLGEASATAVQVLSGVVAGDVVVTDGSFSLRAERDRLGLRRGDASIDDSRAAR